MSLVTLITKNSEKISDLYYIPILWQNSIRYYKYWILKYKNSVNGHYNPTALQILRKLHFNNHTDKFKVTQLMWR